MTVRSASVTGVPRTAELDWAAWMLGIAVVVIALVFLVYPLVNAMLLAFVKNGEDAGGSGLTFANFARFFTAASYQRALWNSVYSGLAATALATVIALPMAYAVARTEIPHRGLISAMTVVPLISPPFIGAYAWIILLGKNGTVTQWLHALTGWTLPTIYGPPGVILALALSYFPYIFLIVQGALAAADPHVEEAARMAGASRVRILRTITLPLVFPAIGAAMLIVFIKAIGDFGVPSILGGEFQVLPTLIYYQINGFFKERRTEVNVKYIDPSYIVRSVPANAQDNVYCSRLAQAAVHAAVAGKTGMLVGRWHGSFVNLPLGLVTHGRRKIDPKRELWHSVLESTGQPANLY